MPFMLLACEPFDIFSRGCHVAESVLQLGKYDFKDSQNAWQHGGTHLLARPGLCGTHFNAARCTFSQLLALSPSECQLIASPNA